MTAANANLFVALRAGFPAELDGVAIETVDTGLAYTWRDVERATAMLANMLESLDLPPSSRVAVQVEKSVEALLLYLAVLRAGHVYLPLNTAYKSDEIGYFLGDAEPAVFVCAPRDFASASRLAFARGTRHVFTLGDDRSGSLLERATHFADTHAPVERKADDLATILYTSGTTGRSKGAMLTHGNLASNALTLKEYWRFTGDDVLIHALPIFHAHGLFVALNVTLVAGSTMIFLPRFDPREVLAYLPRATVLMGVPTFYTRLLQMDALNRGSAGHMRLFVSGSAPLLAETHRAWQERTGHAILERYGMTETSMNTSNPYDGDRIAGSVGFPLPGLQIRVTGASGDALPAGEIGM